MAREKSNCKIKKVQQSILVLKVVLAQANLPEKVSEKKKIDNQCFIAGKCRGQPSNHAVKSLRPHPLWNHILWALVGRSLQFLRFSSKTKGNMRKIPLTKIISHKIIY